MLGMPKLFWALTWFIVAAVLLSYSGYLFVGSIVQTQASKETAPVMIRDEVRPGVHMLSGMVTVPTPCDELSMHTEAFSSTTYILLFKTWREPAIRYCPPDGMPRPFHAVVFAPAAGVDFIATLDGAGLPVVVVPELVGQKTSP